MDEFGDDGCEVCVYFSKEYRHYLDKWLATDEQLTKLYTRYYRYRVLLAFSLIANIILGGVLFRQ